MGFGTARAGQNKDTLPLSTALRLALWGYVPWALCGWALQGYSVLGRCRDTLQLGTVGILGG